MQAKKKRRVPALVKVALFCFALYAAISLVHIQLQIREKENMLDDLNAQIQARTIENDGLREIVEQGASDENIASVARDKLGYAYPNERKFVDASSK